MKTIIKYIGYVVILLAVFNISFKPHKAPKPEIKWYDWNTGYELAKKEHKIAFVFIYSSWCPFCKKMEAEAFKDTAIINKFNNSGYVNIRFNPEKNDTYKMDNYVLNGEQLLLLVGKNKVMGYPSQIYILPGNGPQKDILVESGFRTASELATNLSMVQKRKDACPSGVCSAVSAGEIK